MPAASSQLTQLTGDTFWEFVRGNRFVAVHFWAAWNGSDFMMRRLLESQIPKEVSDLVAIAELDIDPAAHQELCRYHNVLNVPFLAFYREGLLFSSLTGMRSPEVITEQLRELVYG
jgi:hypothetical protein